MKKTENLQDLILVLDKWVEWYFYESDLILNIPTSKKLNLDRDAFSRKQGKAVSHNSWWQSVYLGLIADHTLKIIFLAYESKIFESLKKKVSEDLRFSSVSRFSFWTYKTMKNLGNLISVAIKWVGWVRVDAKNVKFPKYWIWTKSFLAGNNKGHVT